MQLSFVDENSKQEFTPSYVNPLLDSIIKSHIPIYLTITLYGPKVITNVACDLDISPIFFTTHGIQRTGEKFMTTRPNITFNMSVPVKSIEVCLQTMGGWLRWSFQHDSTQNYLII